MASPSVAQQIAALPSEERAEALALLTDEEAEALLYDWRGFLARPDQIAPDGDWDIWMLLAGRGFGKTRTGAEWTREVAQEPNTEIGIVGETSKDIRQVIIPSILDVHPPDERPHWQKTDNELIWPNGSRARCYNATEPDQLRGPQFHHAWSDELAKWKYANETWDMLQFCLRLGDHPRQVVTTTPRPIDLVKKILAGDEGKVHLTRGRTSDNAANLSARFREKIYKRYQGTRLGRQELNAEVLGDLPGALWRQSDIDLYRLTKEPELKRVVVAVDPAVSEGEEANDHGIIVAGLTMDGEGVVLDDSSMEGSPKEWATRATLLAKERDAPIIAEINQGGDMVAHTIRSVAPKAKIKQVRATKGKAIRAEPVASMYEQGRIRHVGQFPELENQMTQMTNAGFQGTGSPDRVDALVWAMSELFPEMAKPIKPERPRQRRRVGWMGS